MNPEGAVQARGPVLHQHHSRETEDPQQGASAREPRRESPFLPAISEGLPTLPGYIFELSQLLAAQQVDLKRVTQVIRTDPSLTAQLLRMWNSSVGNTHGPAETLEEIVVLLGRERLRTLVLTCSLTRQADRAVAEGDLEAFWQHSFLTARLSEALARELHHPQPDLAYLAGLLHDIGRLALLELGFARGLTPEESALAADCVQCEADAHGMNHCVAGRAIGIAWNFPVVLIEVIERHHEPQRATLDPLLAAMVAVADQFCDAHGVDIGVPSTQWQLPDREQFSAVMKSCLPLLDAETHARLNETLRAEWRRLIPLLNSRSLAMPGDRDRQPVAAGAAHEK